MYKFKLNALLNRFPSIKMIIRNYHVKQGPYHWDDGIQYPSFKYYPKSQDFKDPPYEPTKLFRVQRIKSLRGYPHWDKAIMKELKLDKKTGDVVIIKNIPENNYRLWKVKHLIKITPITFPDGFPTDTHGTYLKENGELEVKQRLRPSENSINVYEEFKNNPKRLDGETLRRDSRMKWLNPWNSAF